MPIKPPMLVTSQTFSQLATSETTDDLANTLLQTVIQNSDSQVAWLYLTGEKNSFHVNTQVELLESEIETLKGQQEDWLLWHKQWESNLPQQLTPPAMLPSKLAALSFVFVPLHIRREKTSPRCGLLVVGSANEKSWTDETLAWLAVLSNHAAFILHHLALEARLAEREKELVMLQKALRIAAKGVHKLSQPLTVILGYSSLLMRMMPKESTHRPLIEKIEESSEQVGIIVKKLSLVTQRPKSVMADDFDAGFIE